MNHGKQPSTESEIREERVKLVRSASQAGHPQLSPEKISPWSGLDPDTARALSEAFPAPNPDVVMVRKIRRTTGGKGSYKDPNTTHFIAFLTIPREIMYVAGLRPGDTMLISAWAEGVVRMVRIPEGQ